MPGLSAWAVRRPVIALIAWGVAVIAIFALGASVGGTLNDSYELRDTESTSATELLSSAGVDTGALDSGATLVWSPTTAGASATEPSVMAPVTAALEKIAALGSVSCVTSPTGPSLGTACPPVQPQPSADDIAAMTPELQEAMAQAATSFSAVSPDGHVAYATISFPHGGEDVTAADAKVILDAAQALRTDALRVGANGPVLDAFSEQEPPSSEGIGILVAIVILLIAFGSVIAAGLPIIVALVGLATGQLAVLLAANFLDIATFAPTVAAMIGLGVGIDYSLFVMNRYRQAVLAGRAPKVAALEAVETAGRAVLFAGSTVIISLLGMLVLRINLFNGLAVASGIAVLLVMLSALWFLPALLSLLGTKALAWRLPWGKKLGTVYAEGKAWERYGRVIQRRPIVPAVLAIGIVIVLAIPLLSLRTGFSDDSGRRTGSLAREAFDLRAEGFGPGINGPFLVAVQLPEDGDVDGYTDIVEGLAATDGVAATRPSVGALPLAAQNPAQFGLDGNVAVIAVIPDTSPQDPATSELLERLRTQTNPPLEASTGAQIYVGGTQAITSDFTTVLAGALPVFLLIVVGLGFLALMLLFHSLVIPLTAAVTSLLSFAAAMGITIAVFQWGWLAGPLGVPATGPIFPFLPIMVFSILFGLSMDYQVFLVSRMQEEWHKTGDNRTAVRRGLGGSGRVVVIAALIMTSVFLAFVPSTISIIKTFGVALASAIIIDAFLIRLVFVPSFMSMLGKANWWLPRWLDRALPTVHIEQGDDSDAHTPEPAR